MRNELNDDLWRRMLLKRSIQNNGCWLWTGSKMRVNKPNALVYGEIRINNRLRRVHRVTAALRLGFDLNCRKDVCHTCDTPLCFNPAHLFIGTRADNNKDRARKGRYSYGAKSNRTGLTEEKIVKIFLMRYVEKIGVREIGRQLGMGHASVSQLLSGKRWPHVTRPLIKEYSDAGLL